MLSLSALLLFEAVAAPRAKAEKADCPANGHAGPAMARSAV